MNIKRVLLTLSVAAALAPIGASALLIDGVIQQTTVSLPTDGSDLTITNTGGIDTSFDSSLNNGCGGTCGDDAVEIDGDIDFVDNAGNIDSSGDGIFLDIGNTISAGIVNSGNIFLDGQGWGSAIGVDGTVNGGILNSGVLSANATACEDTLCAATSGVLVVGTVNGGISNTGTIAASTFGPHLSSGFALISAVDTSGTVADRSATVTGDISNTNVIASSDGVGIRIMGSTLNGNIVNGLNATLAGTTGIELSNDAVQYNELTDDVLAITQNGPTGAVINGDIVNDGSILGLLNSAITVRGNATISGDIINSGSIQSDNGGIFVTGSGASIGNIINSGAIFSVSGGTGDNLYAIDIQAGATVSSITNNSGGIIDGFNGGLIIDDSTVNGDITNNAGGTIQTNSGDAIVVRGASAVVTGAIVNAGSLDSSIAIENGATVTGGIVNSGIINEQEVAIFVDNANLVSITNNSSGVITGGSGVAINTIGTGSIGTINNFGQINGAVDFGSAGGTYATNGGTVGGILNATQISIQGSTFSTVQGNLTYSGLISADIQGTANGLQNGTLLVEGVADVTGASVNLVVTGETFINVDDQATILGAVEGLTSDITTATDNSAVISFTISQVGNDLVATAIRTDYDAIIGDAITGTELEGTTGGDNLISVGSALTAAILSGDVPAGSELDNVINQLDALGSAQAVAAASSTLDPDTAEATAVGALSADTAAASTVNARVSALRGDYGFSGAVAGDPLSIHGFWVQAYDNDTDQDGRQGIDGFDADTFGFALGIDSAVSERVNAGLAFSYADTDVEGKIEANEMTIESYRLALYGSYNADNYYMDGQMAYALNNYETDRTLFTGSIASGDHDGDQYSLRIRGGYPIALDSGWYITPKAEMDYTYLQEDKYTEEGAGNAGLVVDSDDVEVLVLGVGVKFAYPITTASETTWIPELSLDYMYDVIGDEVQIDSNFIGVSGAAFITNGALVEQEMYKMGLRIRTFSQSNFAFSAGIDYIQKDDYDSQSLLATMRYDF